MKKKQQQIAFWRYDLYPYLLHGPVVHLEPKKIVEVANYGGARFHYQFLMPKKEGLELGAKLDELCASKREAVDKINAEYKKKLNKLLKEYNQKG